jgi:hypothetical protein
MKDCNYLEFDIDDQIRRFNFYFTTLEAYKAPKKEEP